MLKSSLVEFFFCQITYAYLFLWYSSSSFTPDEWEAYSSENIAKAERERKASVALRSEINGILMQTYVDLRNIFETVNNEFSKRIEETVTAKRSLEKELARVSVSFTLNCIVVKCRKNKRRAIKVSNQNPGKYDKVPVRLRRNVKHIKAFVLDVKQCWSFSTIAGPRKSQSM